MVMFSTLTVVIVLWICAVKHTTLNMYHLLYVSYISYKLYLNKAIKKQYYLRSEYTSQKVFE